MKMQYCEARCQFGWIQWMECPARRMRVASPSKGEGEGEGRSWANSRERVRKLGARPLTLVLSRCEGGGEKV